MPDLAAAADTLRRLHGAPLILANVWDGATARAVVDAGFPALATSSAAVAAAHGFPDADAMPAETAFAAVATIARAVSVPVTADLEAGYGLPAAELAARLIEAGAVGCNLEDTDHHGDAVLVPAEAHAERIAAVKEAGRRHGVDLVVNARVDVYVRPVVAPADQLAEAVRRGRIYRRAGADCVYPIGAVDEEHIRVLVDELGVVNVWARSQAPPIAVLRRLGVARISVGSGLFRATLAAVRRVAEHIAAGDVEWWS